MKDLFRLVRLSHNGSVVPHWPNVLAFFLSGYLSSLLAMVFFMLPQAIAGSHIRSVDYVIIVGFVPICGAVCVTTVAVLKVRRDAVAKAKPLLDDFLE